MTLFDVMGIISKIPYDLMNKLEADAPKFSQLVDLGKQAEPHFNALIPIIKQMQAVWDSVSPDVKELLDTIKGDQQ